METSEIHTEIDDGLPYGSPSCETKISVGQNVIILEASLLGTTYIKVFRAELNLDAKGNSFDWTDKIFEGQGPDTIDWPGPKWIATTERLIHALNHPLLKE